MVASIIHPEGERVWNLSDSIESICVLSALRAPTLTIATMKSSSVRTCVDARHIIKLLFTLTDRAAIQD